MYEYLFLDLEPSTAAPPARALLERLQARRGGLAAAKIEALGLFTAQLGWHARQAALLLRTIGEVHEAAGLKDLEQLDGVVRCERTSLQATARPDDQDRPSAGGIYVHRWFVVETAAVDEFVELSQQGWRDFEARFDARIFGLFARTDDEVTRLLLITRYGDHGVWEASRDPTTDAMAAFLKRQRLTRDTWAASTLLNEI